MKAYKCKECGSIKYGTYCTTCNQWMINPEIVEIIDWEKELLTKKEEK